MLGAFLAGNALPMLVLAALKHEGAIDSEDRSFIAIHVAMAAHQCDAVWRGSFRGHGKSFAALRLSRANFVIVAWQLLPAMAAMALECVLTTAR